MSVARVSVDNIPQEVNVKSAKWVFARTADSNGFITQAKARLVARRFGQQSGVDCFKMFAPT